MQKISEWARLAFFVVWALVGLVVLIYGAKMTQYGPSGMMQNKMMDYRQDTRQDIRDNYQDRMMYRQDAVRQTDPGQQGTESAPSAP